jgi:hypothetical protein
MSKNSISGLKKSDFKVDCPVSVRRMRQPLQREEEGTALAWRLSFIPAASSFFPILTMRSEVVLHVEASSSL